MNNANMEENECLRTTIQNVLGAVWIAANACHASFGAATGVVASKSATIAWPEYQHEKTVAVKN